MYIPERFIRHIWKNLYLRLGDLKTADGRPIKILSPGKENPNEGADFLGGKLLLDDSHLSGNVEVHSRTSDWTRHQHSQNPRYADVVLHVVFEHDAEPPNEIPVLELKSFLSDTMHAVIARCIKDEMDVQQRSARFALDTIRTAGS